MVVIFESILDETRKQTILRELGNRGMLVHWVDSPQGSIMISEGEVDIQVLETCGKVSRVVRPSTPFQLAHRSFNPDGTVITVGDVEIGRETLTIIAGPCAVESEEQLFRIAEAVKSMGAHILRGGAFKPRTSPYSFQGLGERGLEILAKAREKFSIPVVTEATSPENAVLVAQYADIIQIGARNMQNFELLKKVAILGKPVLLKRGLSATIEDWLLAAEYILSLGNFQVILCERGIRTIERFTRNTLDLNAIPVVKDLSHLPIFVDPSHGTGLREKVIPMALAGVSCGADGVMVEVHHAPEQALSDGPQSLYPEQFRRLVNNLQVISVIVGKELNKEKSPAGASPAFVSKSFSQFKVAFLGEKGSFSSQVAQKAFPRDSQFISCYTFREVFEKVASDEATHGVVPIENTITGSIHANYDLLLDFPEIFVVGERFIKVSQHLGVYPGTGIDDIQFLFAHPQAFSQCSRFLESLRGVKIIDVGNTEEAARKASEFGKGSACISSEEAIRKHGLELIEEDVEDTPCNFTRFIILSRYFEPRKEHDKVSCVFRIPNRSGALFEVLEVFYARSINLIKLESRPIPGEPWEYLFYIDWEGNLIDRKFEEALEELRKKTTFLRILGSYHNRWKLLKKN